MLLAIFSSVEILFGSALLAYPPIVVRLMFGSEISDTGAVMSRLAGVALIALSLSCWPRRDSGRAAIPPVAGMLAYNLGITAFLAIVGVRGERVGVMLWPAAALHAGLTLCSIALFRKTAGPGIKAAVHLGDERQAARRIDHSVSAELMSKTIMLIHGAWVTTDCWTSFRDFFESKGHSVVVPEWPYLERSAEELRRSPDPRLAKMTIKGLVDHFEKQIRDLPEQPVLIGHSFGGLIVQMLLDRGLGAAGVAIDAVPPRWVLPSVTAIGSALPVLLVWRGWSRIASMSFKTFSTTIANTLSQSEQHRAYDRYIVPTPGRIYFQAALASEMPSILRTQGAHRCCSLRRARTARARRPWSKQCTANTLVRRAERTCMNFRIVVIG
jgi:pimeloyl-ACP methyl ester carboxylesterase